MSQLPPPQPSGHWPAQPQPRRGWPWWLTTLVIVGGVFAVVGVFGALTGQLGDEDDSRSSVSVTACDEFRRQAAQYRAGEATLADTLARLRGLGLSTADRAEDAGVRRALEQLSTAKLDEAADAIQQMEDACNDL